ncbi:frataxin-like protein [Planctomycetes bacterium Pla163]|uniref:Frataxin-like protein n=1 Tax=Rohdeia mirabilis TaxID=2528008 RepID=A0A518CX97_9BACT|nr:frataxin-like protein [Planctomycetes bacterium Pla163]
MDSIQYDTLADHCLNRIEDWLQDFDPDELDYATADGVVKFEFPDGVTFVLNRQAGSHQMWYAAGVRAWHYDWNGETWVDDRDGHDLYANVARTVGEKLGRDVAI